MSKIRSTVASHPHCHNLLNDSNRDDKDDLETCTSNLGYQGQHRRRKLIQKKKTRLYLVAEQVHMSTILNVRVISGYMIQTVIYINVCDM